MRKTVLFAFIVLLSGCRVSCEQENTVVASYVTSWTEVMPDAFLTTHLNYAFAHVNESFDGVRIDSLDRLKAIVSLKQKNPDLKVILSIGGWGSGNFSEMAADKALRRSFCRDCARKAKALSLDGIDIDWEYPGNGKGALISWSARDKDNFTLLMKDLRKALGRDKVLSLASCCDPKYIDFPAIMDAVDFVNIMSYDMNEGDSTFHCALYPSVHTATWTTDSSVKAHIAAGVPAGKIVVGVPFHGKGKRSYPGGRSFKRIHPVPEGYVEMWDEQANAPYIADSEGNFVLGYENERSLADKIQYIRDNGLRGIMNWDYAGDDTDFTLTRIMHTLAE